MKWRIAVLLMAPMLAHAQAVLPLRAGFYSSGGCKDPTNAELRHFDGKNLDGAHSASCRDEVVKLHADVFQVTSRCPAEPLSDVSVSRPMTFSEQVTVHSDTTFDLSPSDDPKTIKHFRFCGKTLDSTAPR